MKKFIYDAVKGHYVSERNKAIANIKLHTGNPVQELHVITLNLFVNKQD